MPCYAAIIRGENFPARLLGEAEGVVGFFSTRFVEASDGEAAELAAIDLVKNELRPLLGAQREAEASPTLYLDEICEIKELPDDTPGSGATWFPMNT